MSRRCEENCLPGFNWIAADVDNGITVESAQGLMSDWTYLLYTTKSHQDHHHRFRMLFPTSHVLDLSAKEYRAFMENFFDWLPFEVDRQTGQRARKWLANPGAEVAEIHHGELLDVLQFIPKTRRAEQQAQQMSELRSLSNTERWFIKNTEEGNRSNQLIRYAYMLVDNGLNINDIRDKVLLLNAKLKPGLDESEIHSTIMISAAKKIHIRDTQQLKEES